MFIISTFFGTKALENPPSCLRY